VSDAAAWFLVAGGVFVVMALSASVVKRLPLTTGLLYLGIGVLLGPHVAGLLRLDPVAQSALLERATEVAVIVSLFTAGLKLRTPFDDRLWRLPGRLAVVSMTVTVGLVAAVGVGLLGLPLGAAVLLGAVLAPTDPVLASDVQVENPTDRDRLRFGLTGEAGFNDGTAFPFVMLGLGLLGTHELGELGWRWVAVDVLWAVAAGLGIGAGLGTLVGRLVLYLRREHREAVGLDDFLALGLIALSYGVALLAHAYGFLAVFAAGLALRRIEASASGERPPDEAVHEAVVAAASAGGEAGEEVATDPEKAPAYMAQAVLGFNEQLERIAEVLVVVALGSMLTVQNLSASALWFAPLLFVVIRPLAVAAGLIGSRTPPIQAVLIAWFGVRGVGSIYYLMFALQHGVAGAQPDLARELTALTLCVVAASILVHGVSVTPLMNWYGRLRGG
jgi:sodium/hydrogen antiporter